MRDSTRVEFKPPKSFIPPEDDGKGQFDAVCTFRIKPDGSLCLVQLGNTDMPGYDDKEGKAEAKPDYSDMAASMQQPQEQPEEQGY